MYYAVVDGQRVPNTEARTPDLVLLKLYELDVMPPRYDIEVEREKRTKRCSIGNILTGAASGLISLCIATFSYA